MVVQELLTVLGFKVDQKEVNKYDQVFGNIQKKVSNLVAGIGATLGGIYLGKQIYQLTGELEQNTVAFETMIGNAEKAHSLLSDISKFSAVTPYQESDLISVTKLMLNFGISSDQVMGNLQMLGDIASGDSNKLYSLSLAFSQMTSAGRLQGQDLLQMINAGFNPLQIISQKTGQSMASLRKKMESGGITVKMVNDAFKSATSEGGRFYKMMEKQSQTLFGIVSNFQDMIGRFLRGIGGGMLPTVKNLLNKIYSYFSENFDSILQKTSKFINSFLGVLGYWSGIIIGIFEYLGLDKLFSKKTFSGLQIILGVVLEVFKGFADGLILLLPVIKALLPYLALLGGALTGIAIGMGIISALNPFTLIIIGIIAVITIVGLLYRNWDKIVKFFFKTLDNIKKKFFEIFNWVRRFVIGILDKIFPGWDKKLKPILDIIKFFTSTFSKIGKDIFEIFKNPIDINRWKKLGMDILNYWGGLVNGLIKLINSIHFTLPNWKIFGEMAGKDVGFNIPEIPSFAKGVENFQGGLAYVHQGEMLANLPKGTDVLNRSGMDRLSSALLLARHGSAGRSAGTQINVQSNINLSVPAGTPADQADFLKEKVAKMIDQAWETTIRQGMANFPRADFSGGAV